MTEIDIDGIVNDLVDEFGKGACFKLGDKEDYQNLEDFLDATPMVNKVIGAPGLPYGRIIEISGPENSGKTTLLTHLLANNQKRGGISVLADMEHKFDPKRAERIGVNVKDLVMMQPAYAEILLEQMVFLIMKVRVRYKNRPVLIGWDSIAGTPTKVEMEGSFDDQQPALLARVLARGLHKITELLSQEKILLVCINQQRDKVGGFGFGAKTSTPGGRAARHHCIIRLEVIRGQKIRPKQGADPTGAECIVKCTKNQIAAPFREAKFYLDFVNGIDIPQAHLQVFVESGIIECNRKVFSFKDDSFKLDRWPEIFEKHKEELIQRIIQIHSWGQGLETIN